MGYPYTKKCPICEQNFLIEDFSQSKRKYCYNCSPKNRGKDYPSLFNAMKKKVIELKGGKCQKCGYNKCIAALHFHHRNPAEKSFSLSMKSYSCEWDRFLLEAEKCDLLCSNCHMEEHYMKEEEQQPTSNLVGVEEIKFQKTKNFCVDCNKEISLGALRCIECNNKNKESKNKPSREELKNLIRNIPFTQIGNKYHVSDNAIRKWCDGYNLPRKKSEINAYSDEEWENI